MSVVEEAAVLPQHLLALNRANTVRREAAGVKRDLKAGRVSLSQALADSRSSSLSVLELLMSQRAWGRKRAVRLLRSRGEGRWPIAEMTKVRDLTPAQREFIAGAA